MQRSLGEKLGEGHFADVYAWAPGQVVKLFKAGIPRRIPSSHTGGSAAACSGMEEFGAVASAVSCGISSPAPKATGGENAHAVKERRSI